MDEALGIRSSSNWYHIHCSTIIWFPSPSHPGFPGFIYVHCVIWILMMMVYRVLLCLTGIYLYLYWRWTHGYNLCKKQCNVVWCGTIHCNKNSDTIKCSVMQCNVKHKCLRTFSILWVIKQAASFNLKCPTIVNSTWFERLTFNLSWSRRLFYQPQREGNVFRSICLSTGEGVEIPVNRDPPGGRPLWTETPPNTDI